MSRGKLTPVYQNEVVTEFCVGNLGTFQWRTVHSVLNVTKKKKVN